MINIDIPIDESVNDKYKRLSPTGYPEIFIKLEELDTQDFKKYSHIKSLESLIKTVLEKKTYFTDGDIIIDLTTPAYYLTNNMLLLQTGKVKVGNIYTLNLPQTEIDLNQFQLDLLDFNFAQYKLEITPIKEQLITYIYPEKKYMRFITEYLTTLIKPNKINIFSPNAPFVPNSFTNIIIKIMGVKLSPMLEPWIILKYSSAFINESNLPFIEKNIINTKQILLEKNIKNQNTVWQSILSWIHRNIGTDLQIIKKNKQKIINKFLAKPCVHLYNKYVKKEELKLDADGSFYECVHGNKILCIHNFIEGDKIKQLGEVLYSGNTICKICGEEFITNPVYMEYSKNKSGEIDEIKKFIFKRAISVVSHIEFIGTVTPEYISKFAGSIVNSIDTSVRNNFYDLDKQKGIDADIVLVIKDVLCTIHIYASLMLLIIKNPTIINYKNTTPDYNNLKKRIIGDLMKILHQQLIKIKIFKPLNLENAFTTILDKLTNENVKIPREISKTKPEDYFMFNYTGKQEIKVDSYPEELINVLIKLSKNKNIIGNIISGKFIFLPEFLEWQKYLQTFKSKFNNYMLMKCTIKYGEIPLVHYPQLTYNTDYIGYIYGLEPSFHKHIWALACLGKKQININQIELNEELDFIICNICKQKKQISKNIVTELNKLTIKKSKVTFYKNYCPVKFNHKFTNNICEYCKYGTEDFFNNYELPDKYINLPPVTESENQFTKSTLDIKNTNQSPKLLNIPKITKEMYSNFWKTLGQYEDVTFKNLLLGKEGNKNSACFKLIGFLNTLNIILGQIQFLTENSNKILEQFYLEFNKNTLTKIIAKIYNLINETQLIYSEDTDNYYNNLLNVFIEIFNELPPKFSEFWFKKILELTKLNALSEDDVKAKSLITYKTKIIDESIEQSTEKNTFTLEGFDYDGKNHKE